MLLDKSLARRTYSKTLFMLVVFKNCLEYPISLILYAKYFGCKKREIQFSFSCIEIVKNYIHSIYGVIKLLNWFILELIITIRSNHHFTDERDF